MPFGIHRGRPLAELPADYFGWLAALPTLRDPLRAAVRDEQLRRLGQHSAAPGTIPPELHRVASEIVGAGHRALAKRVHPDAGGTTADMVRINLAAEALRALVERAA